MKKFQQARGSNALVTMGFEEELSEAATSGVGIKFNGMTMARSRDLNQSGTIQPGRSPVEPFQGNGDVGGDITIPNDINQMYYFLKAAFGQPATTSSGGVYTHVFTIGNEQPSLTIEKLFADIAEKEVFLGCKVSNLAFSANASGQENTVTCSFVGCKPQATVDPIAISSIAVASGTATVTTTDVHGFSQGDIVAIAGSGNRLLDGKHAVASAASTTTFAFATTAADGTTSYTDSSKQPGVTKSQFTSITNATINRLGTFSASLKKDNVNYDCAKEFSIAFNMGIDTDQRCIGDNGYLSSLPEGTVEITTNITALFRSAELQKIAANNETVAWELKYENADGSLTIYLPENKVQEAGVPIESAMGLSQSMTIQAFCSDASNGGSAATITLVNKQAAA